MSLYSIAIKKALQSFNEKCTDNYICYLKDNQRQHIYKKLKSKVIYSLTQLLFVSDVVI